jgi:hypothetical protein
VQLLFLLQQQLFASVAYSTAMEQLEGSRPVLAAGASDADVESSWGPVAKVKCSSWLFRVPLLLRVDCDPSALL